MARTVALLFTTAFALAALFIAWNALRLPDAPPTQPAQPSAVAREPEEPASSPAATANLEEPLSALTDDDVRALVARLVTLDGVAALQDDALVHLVTQHLDDALRVSSSLADSPSQTRALVRVADFAVGLDAPAAHAAASSIAVTAVRRIYTSAVLEAWAAIDPGAVLAFAEANPLNDFEWFVLARFDPYAVITLTNRLGAGTSGGLGDPLQTAQSAALYAWAEEDPVSAAAYAEAIANEQFRNQALQYVARGYARYDARAAWQWARSLDTPSFAADAVLRELAQTDVDTALDLLLETPQDAAEGVLLRLMFSDLGPDGMRRVAETLVAKNDPAGVQMLLARVVSSWAGEQPQAALDWVIENAARFGTDPPFRALGPSSQNDPEFALRTLRRLPPEQHAAWLEVFGVELAQAAPTEAEAAVKGLVGKPGFEGALSAVAVGLARWSDPRPVVSLLERLAPETRGPLIERVGALWARNAPAEAARWAQSFDDSAERALAVRAVATGWRAVDRQAALAWVVAMPRGAPREAGIGGLFEQAARNGVVDEELLAQ